MMHSCRVCSGPIRDGIDHCPHCGALRPAVGILSAGDPDPPIQPWHEHFERGLEYIGQQDFESAVADLSQAIVEAPETEVASCYATRGYAHLCLHDYTAAVDDC